MIDALMAVVPCPCPSRKPCAPSRARPSAAILARYERVVARCGQTLSTECVVSSRGRTLRRAAIGVMQAAENGVGNHVTDTRAATSRYRRVSIERHVRPRFVVVLDVRPKRAQQVPLTERNDVIDALASDAADHAFSERIGVSRRLHRIGPIRMEGSRSHTPSIRCWGRSSNSSPAAAIGVRIESTITMQTAT